MSKHTFAFYIENIKQKTLQTTVGQEIFIEDKDLCHRIQHVVKLEKSEHFSIFDRQYNALLQLKKIVSKKSILSTLIKKEKNNIITPHITFLLPLLKKEHFEQSLYSLVELGAQIIQPIVTQKSQKAFKFQKAYNRFTKIMIAAAEQSKHFAFPTLEDPIEIGQYKSTPQKKSTSIFFDPEGINANDLIKNLKDQSYEHITLMIGPEGDLTIEEKETIKQQGFIFCKLTPTVLRACQAVPVGLGLLRSLL